MKPALLFFAILTGARLHVPIQDGKELLEVKWFANSYMKIPVWR